MGFWKRRTKIQINTSLRAFLKRAVVNQSLTALKRTSTAELSPNHKDQVLSRINDLNVEGDLLKVKKQIH